ncbi:MAG: inorganic diphosphatase [Myxococcota bacterium]
MVLGLAGLMMVAIGCGGSRSRPPPSLFEDVHLVSGIAAENGDGTFNAVIEIPAGTTAKYQVDHESGLLFWEERDGELRRVDYLGYPGNYGMIPRTLQPRSDDPSVEGGDGDPLDVLVLGDPVERGDVLRIQVLGLLRLLDEGERDDKVLAVRLDDPERLFREVANLEELDARYPNLRQIIELWFVSYDPGSGSEAQGWLDRDEALEVLAEAVAAYETHRAEGSANALRPASPPSGEAAEGTAVQDTRSSDEPTDPPTSE